VRCRISVRRRSGHPDSVLNGSNRPIEGVLVKAVVCCLIGCLPRLPPISPDTIPPSFLALSALLLEIPFRIACCLSFPCFFRSLISSGCVMVTNANIFDSVILYISLEVAVCLFLRRRWHVGMRMHRGGLTFIYFGVDGATGVRLAILLLTNRDSLSVPLRPRFVTRTCLRHFCLVH
jgi:hypothetical protein